MSYEDDIIKEGIDKGIIKIKKNKSIIDQKIQYHTTKKQKLEELFRTMLNELMTGKIRVV